jgi:hypothetical protein
MLKEQAKTNNNATLFIEHSISLIDSLKLPTTKHSMSIQDEIKLRIYIYGIEVKVVHTV